MDDRHEPQPSSRDASTDHDVHELIRRRWSPLAFSSQPVADRDLRSVLEAARWGPSCFNEQPWRYIVARREQEAEFARMLSCLVEKNQRWAQAAPVLMLSVARLAFAANDRPNRHALHDVGLATAQLSLQAAALGLGVHQMAGFSPDRARELYAIPDSFEPVAAIALGYPGAPDQLPEDLRARDRGARIRHPQAEFVFAGTWDTPLS
ncbi:nitroreductase family protein [Enhygromyxa salina]|uniref:Putative NAD(P)H nitroreductase n=1 Tax=Enhygromyxa salina TaxID=215803 RepID=A0A2S9Y3G1_9BACT|nr:nitroreductase family protein [Enhygromyxa salina]PRP99638.1 putative NAD(P)H nitroreductase [Enhygromyxa salina]